VFGVRLGLLSAIYCPGTVLIPSEVRRLSSENASPTANDSLKQGLLRPF
jgi:hypothetical protein